MNRAQVHDAATAMGIGSLPRLHFGNILLGPGPLEERIAHAVALAVDFQNTHTAWSLLQALAGPLNLSGSALENLASCVQEVSHVGFLLPGGIQKSTLESVARSMGLKLAERRPSAVFSRELGCLAGCETVDTHIFRLEASGQSNGPICIELFVPDAESCPTDAWIAANLGTHVGLLVRSRDDLARIHGLLAGCARCIPSFMQGQPKENPREGITLLYYDLALPGKEVMLRIEFCHVSRAVQED